MNLFVIGWNLPEGRDQEVLAELKKMNEIYPRLDSTTLWHRRSTSGSLFTASMHTADRAAAPRRYVTQATLKLYFIAVCLLIQPVVIPLTTPKLCL